LITQNKQAETNAGERLRPALNEQVAWAPHQKTAPVGAIMAQMIRTDR